MTCLLRVLLVPGAVAETIGQPQPDRVILQNTSGNESGLLVWGRRSEEDPEVFKTPGGDVSVGDVAQSSEANQVVAFTAGRPPVMLSSVNWDDAAPETLTFPNPYELRVRVWMLCANRDCTGR